MRERDEPIPPDETLYRWVSLEQVNGTEVLPSAIDLACSSVNRDKYWEDPLDSEPLTPAQNGLATTCESNFPTGLSLNEVPYEFFTVDCPTEDNDAHAEIRSGRKPSDDKPSGDRPQGRKPKSKAAKLQLRSSLAQTMTVVKQPTAPA